MILKTITQEELKSILDIHEKYLNGDINGKRADLRYADLSYANLRSADLRYANLRYADLINANLTNANLRSADLRYANLRYADLINANLRYADLRYADLSHADLINANLRGVELTNANLRYANLSHADLSHADLTNADLRYANLTNANLSHTDLRSTKNIPSYIDSITNILPEGDIIGYKKARLYKTVGVHVIVKLLIKSDAKRSNATGRKCRCNECIVLDITDLNGNQIDPDLIVVSVYDSSFIYKIGETIKVDNFDDDRWNECSSGIHFFITRQEAKNY